MIRVAVEGYGQCKINALAENIISALEYDSLAVLVLEKLCMLVSGSELIVGLVRRVRDAVLEKSPGILDMLLKHSCSNDKAFERVPCGYFNF